VRIEFRYIEKFDDRLKISLNCAEGEMCRVRRISFLVSVNQRLVL
jgi:hypothetical protein